MEIKWTPYAKQAYLDNVSYVRDEFGRTVALDFVNKVLAAEDKIKRFPTASALVLGLNISNHEFRYVPIKGPIVLVYEVTDDLCIVRAVWNTKRNPSVLQKLLQ